MQAPRARSPSPTIRSRTFTCGIPRTSTPSPDCYAARRASPRCSTPTASDACGSITREPESSSRSRRSAIGSPITTGARTVDIHRKPGYDPVELFVDPDLKVPQLRVARRLLQKALGFRMLMDVIPLRAELVKGTHGRLPSSTDDGPVVIGTRRDLGSDRLDMTEVKNLILRHWQ